MFSVFSDEDVATFAPTVATTGQKLKCGEPDWYPPVQAASRREQTEVRDNYWCAAQGNMRNHPDVEERDMRVPKNNYQYPGRRGARIYSPKHNLNYLPQQNASYLAAIKAVNESMNADGRGNVTAMRGLWRVFDAAMTELGTELGDSLSNKAIFEGKEELD